MINNRSENLAAFYLLSSSLTGFKEDELRQAGVGPQYLDKLVEGTGELNASDMLDRAASTPMSDDQWIEEIWDSERFGPIARNIILMWYVGSWFPLSDSWHRDFFSELTTPLPQHVISADAYREGLVWPAIGAHPPGAKPPGFGSWAKSPT